MNQPSGSDSPSGLSVVVLTFNEERNLPACLSSLKGLPCDVFVVDSGSTDRTVDLARAAGATVVQHPFEHYSAQRNWAQRNLPFRGEWILHLDADERLTPPLVQEIATIVRHPPDGVRGFLLRKRTIFMGRWIKHGGHYPSYHLRLFRPAFGRCEDRLYDQHFIVDGEIRRLAHDYLDVLTPDLGTWTARHSRWAALEARELMRRPAGHAQVQARLHGHPIERRRWLRAGPYGHAPLFARAFLYWLYRYFVMLGVLDGKEGLIFHFLQGCWYRFLVDAMLFEQTRSQKEATHTLHMPSRAHDGSNRDVTSGVL